MNKKRLCCFYVNDIHFITMLLPYINERINENTEVITILETDMSRSADKVIAGIQGKKSDKLLKIDWGRKKLNYLYECDIKNKLIIINGRDNFIREANEILDNKTEECTILDCYEILQGSEDLQRILESHDKVVNTSGEHNPEEIFTGYTQKSYKKVTL